MEPVTFKCIQTPRRRGHATWGELGRDGLTATLSEVFRYHGATPHFIDLCENAGNVTSVLSKSLGGEEE